MGCKGFFTWCTLYMYCIMYILCKGFTLVRKVCYNFYLKLFTKIEVYNYSYFTPQEMRERHWASKTGNINSTCVIMCKELHDNWQDEYRHNILSLTYHINS